MAVATDNICIPERSKILDWMDNLIFNYKTEWSAVSSKNGEIVWAKGIYRHSIALKGDRFIIDGKEVFIDSELWNNYVKLRELTGAIYIRAPRKIAFQNDWSDLSNEQVLENIHYLQKNYKKYKISTPDMQRVQLDDVVMCRDRDDLTGLVCITINNKKYYRNEIIGKELIDLMHVCRMEVLPLKDKIIRWYNQNRRHL